MRTATAIYHAPEGDNKVVEMGGLTFFDGQSVDLNSNDHDHLINKLSGNQHFDFELGEEVADEKPKRGPGRPKKEFGLSAQQAAQLDQGSQQAAANAAVS